MSTATTVQIEHVTDVVTVAAERLRARLPLGVDVSELVSAGNLALVQVFGRATGSISDVRAFCYRRVFGAMQDELRKRDTLGRRTRARVHAVRVAVAALEQRLQRTPTDAEVAMEIASSATEVARVLAVDPVLVAESEAAHVADEADGPREDAERSDLREQLSAALDGIPYEEGFVLRSIYLDGLSVDTVAAKLGLSCQRVYQLREKALKRLRAKLQLLSQWVTLAS